MSQIKGVLTMSHSQFNYYVVSVGLNFACSMALQEGVTYAQVQLWRGYAKPVTNEQIINNLAF